MRIRIRASRAPEQSGPPPSLQLEFGWQASNDSAASVKISQQDVVVDARPNEPVFYQWEVPLSEIYPRNLVRGTAKMGDLPSPSEFVKIVNSSVSSSAVQVEFVEIVAPVYHHWPPASHFRVLGHRADDTRESTYARQVIAEFMPRAWRRSVSKAEVDQKLALYEKIRPQCSDAEDALLEVLATVLSSPHFLYLVQQSPATTGDKLTNVELATRLSMFLWCSAPDDTLQKLATAGQLSRDGVLEGQVRRLLRDPRADRFARQFVRQWLGLRLLDYLDVDRDRYPQFHAHLRDAMQDEPIALFQEMLRNDHSVLDFIHADYAMVNERLARHYGLQDVFGNHLRRVQLNAGGQRGGLLTQAGLLAMNSDGKDSHPLKRGIWLLDNLLNDPPPPPPPAVPEIDLADPEIAKLSLKERMEDHRNQAACRSCHAKIDPWGIALENFDAVGAWRNDVDGRPIDATSRLFNGQELDGIDGLKRFLLEHRQDQFVRAMVYKMVAFAVGRPLTFRDRSSIEQITTDLRRQDDGLATMVTVIAKSELFRSR